MRLAARNIVPSSAENSAVENDGRPIRVALVSSSRPSVAASAASESTSTLPGSSAAMTKPSGATMRAPRTPYSRFSSSTVSRTWRPREAPSCSSASLRRGPLMKSSGSEQPPAYPPAWIRAPRPLDTRRGGRDRRRGRRLARAHQLQQRAGLGELGIEAQGPTEEIVARARIALFERDAREAEQRAGVVGIVPQHPVELLLGGRGGTTRDVQVGGEQVRVEVAGVDLQRAGHEGAGLGVAALATPQLGPAQRVGHRQRLAAVPRRPQPPQDGHGTTRLMRASRARPLPRSSRPPAPWPCPPGAVSSCLPSAPARAGPRSRRPRGSCREWSR